MNGMKYPRDFSGYWTFSTTLNTLELLTTFSDVDRHPTDSQK
jgi:hypothetical protein